MTFKEGYIAGCFVGFSETLVGHSLDTLKVNKQNNVLQSFKLKNLYRGINQALFSSVLTNSLVFGVNRNLETFNINSFGSGFLTGLLNGFLTCPLENKKIQKQNSINNIRYFRGVHLSMLRESLGYSLYFGTYKSLRDNEVPIYISGSISGVISWIFTYPIDVITTRFKSDKNKSIFDCYLKGNLWNGIEFCLLRSMITNSINFLVYETVLDYINIYNI